MDALLQAGLVNAALAAVLAVPAALASRRSRPALAHALWLVVLLKLLTPPLLRLPLPWLEQPVEETPALASAEPVLPCPVCVRDPVRLEDEGEFGDPREAAQGPPPAPFPWAEVLKGTLVTVWLGGALLWWALAGWRVRRFCGLLRDLPPAPQEAQAEVGELAGLLGLSAPRLWLVQAVVSPLVLAPGWPAWLIFPRRLWDALPVSQRRVLLLHELAHLRRRDHWVRLLELVVLGLYWWHPVVWYARRKLQEAEEEGCDALVLQSAPGSAGDYAAGLLATLAFVSGRALPLPAGASGAGRLPLLKRRLTMILSGTSPAGLRRWQRLLLLGLAACVLPLVPGWARPEGPVKAGPARPADRSGELHKWLAGPSCQACHMDPHARPSPHGKVEPGWMKAHNDVVALMDELAAQRARLADTERKLKVALDALAAARDRAERQDAAQQRLRELDLKLERLQKEIETLRKELKPAGVNPFGGGAGPVLNEWPAPKRNALALLPGTPEGGAGGGGRQAELRKLLTVARQEFDRGRYKEALAVYEELSRVRPSSAEALQAQGEAVRCHVALGRVDRARALCLKIREALPRTDPETVKVWEDWLAAVLKELGSEKAPATP